MKNLAIGPFAKGAALVALVASNAYFAASASRSRTDLENLEVTFHAARTRMVDLERSLDQLYAYSEVLGQITRGNPLPLKSHEQIGLESFTGKTVMLPALVQKDIVPSNSASISAPPEQETTAEQRAPAFFTVQATFEKLLLLRERTDLVTQKVRGLLTLVKVKRDYFNGVPTIHPADGPITSGFGMRLSPFDGRRVMHAGIDFAAEVGSVIRASADGVVTFAGNFEDLGKTVVIGHGFGIQSRYGHTEKFLVQSGQKVRRGQPIALVGMTGNTTGPHLHYEIWVNDVAVDPMEFLIDRAPAEYQSLNMAHENMRASGQGG